MQRAIEMGFQKRFLMLPLLTFVLAACDDRAGLNKTDLRETDVEAAMIGFFAEMCLDAMPVMQGTRESLVAISVRDFGTTPELDREALSTVTHRTSGITLMRGTAAWPDFAGENRCEVSAQAVRVNRTVEAMLATFEERSPPSTSLAEAIPDGAGEERAWTVNGATPNMRLEVATGAAAAGGNRQTALRLVWRN
ncbi:MAG: hypothetical protein AAF415_21105 [Pseudomonadota bacterium]